MPVYKPREDVLIQDGAHLAPEDVPRAVAAFGGFMVTKGVELPRHQHRKAQLVLALGGVVRCEADYGVWIVPPRCAVWIPADISHSVTLVGNVEAYCLFVEPNAVPALPSQCCALSVSPLLEHLLLYAAQMPILYDEEGADGRIAKVLLDQLVLAPVEKLYFPMPFDTKLREIATAMMANPSDRATIEEWARRIAVAPRTLTRTLKRETGMSFGRWRQQFYILTALQRLDQGASVQDVALELGYESTSAFVTMFGKALGKPPARYFAERRNAER